jgi:copper(I)-binding protein
MLADIGTVMSVWPQSLAFLARTMPPASRCQALVPRYSWAFKRKGAHLLLTGFTKRLDAYASFAMTLAFEKAGSVVIEVMVEEAEQPKAQ